MLTTNQVLDKLVETIISLRQEIQEVESGQHYVVYPYGLGFGVYKTDERGRLLFLSKAYYSGPPKPKGLVANFYEWLPDAEKHAHALADELNRI